MKLWEAIKDMLGILDDTQDYLDKINRKLKDAYTILDKLESELGDVERTINKLNERVDLDEAEKLMSRLDIDKPRLLGETSLETLEEALEELDEIETKLERETDEEVVKRKVLSHIKQARNRVTKGIEENQNLLKQLDIIQTQSRSFGRTVAASMAAAGVIALGAIAAYGAYASAVSTAMRVALVSVPKRIIDSASNTVTQAADETELLASSLAE